MESGAGTVTVHLFIDANGDGLQDLVESDLSGVEVKITDSGGGMQTLSSDASGNVSARNGAGDSEVLRRCSGARAGA